MKKKVIRYTLIIFFLAITFASCIESFKIENETYEKVLVVETTITNELKNHKIKLSNVIRLTDSIDPAEHDAQVWIETSDQNTYHFSENENGIYISDEIFKAIPDIVYKLYIVTSEGKQYESREEYLTPEAVIQNLYAEKVTISEKAGAQIFIDSNEDVGEAKYFRYEFEETYKIITPYYITLNATLLDIVLSPPMSFGYRIHVKPNYDEKQVCYSTDKNTSIIQANTNNQSENNLRKQPIHFISEDNHIIRNRYSILVKQYVQSFDSFNYYKVLKKLNSHENILLENQPGFLTGNLYSVDDDSEKVIGFFDVSYMSKKRIYFNYYDLNLMRPPYQYSCLEETLNYYISSDRSIIHRRLTQDPKCQTIDYEEEWSDELEDYVVFQVTLITPECGDCRSFSSNIKPNFWED